MTQTSWTLGSIIIIQSDTSGAPTSACVSAGVPGRERDGHLWCCCVKSKSNPTPGFTDIRVTRRNLLMLPYALNSCCSHSHTHERTHTQGVGSYPWLEMYYFTVCHYSSFIPSVLRWIWDIFIRHLSREWKGTASQTTPCQGNPENKVLDICHYKSPYEVLPPPIQ